MHPQVSQQVTFLYTADLAQTADFYEQVIGLELVLDQEACRIYRVSESGFLGFCQKDGLTIEPQQVIFTLVTPEVDAWYQHLLAQGIAIEQPPAHNPQYNIYHFFVRDPNGYLLEVQTFLDPAWPA